MHTDNFMQSTDLALMCTNVKLTDFRIRVDNT